MFKTATKAKANVVAGKLILSCPNAMTPVVWQMDLTQVRSSALEVRDEQSQAVLVLKTPKSESVDIAQFRSKNEAVGVLMAVTRAMEGAQDQMRTGGHDPMSLSATRHGAPRRKRGRVKSTVLWLVSVVLVAFVLVIGIGMAGTMFYNSQDVIGNTIEPLAGAPQDTPAPSLGVPQSADEFLNTH